jgi:hypothetical protein
MPCETFRDLSSLVVYDKEGSFSLGLKDILRYPRRWGRKEKQQRIQLLVSISESKRKGLLSRFEQSPRGSFGKDNDLLQSVSYFSSASTSHTSLQANSVRLTAQTLPQREGDVLIKDVYFVTPS